MKSVVVCVSMAAVVCALLCLPRESCSQTTPVGVPNVAELLGKSIAEHLIEQQLERIAEDMSHSGGLTAYEKALKQYEKSLRKFQARHAKARSAEEKQLQRLIDDTKSYTPGSADVNRMQEEKQKKIFDYLQQCQKNDVARAEELKVFIQENYPRLESFIKTM